MSEARSNASRQTLQLPFVATHAYLQKQSYSAHWKKGGRKSCARMPQELQMLWSTHTSRTVEGKGIKRYCQSRCHCYTNLAKQNTATSKHGSGDRGGTTAALTICRYSRIIFNLSSPPLFSSFCSMLLIILQEALLAPITFLYATDSKFLSSTVSSTSIPATFFIDSTISKIYIYTTYRLTCQASRTKYGNKLYSHPKIKPTLTAQTQKRILSNQGLWLSDKSGCNTNRPPWSKPKCKQQNSFVTQFNRSLLKHQRHSNAEQPGKQSCSRGNWSREWLRSQMQPAPLIASCKFLLSAIECLPCTVAWRNGIMLQESKEDTEGNLPTQEKGCLANETQMPLDSYQAMSISLAHPTRAIWPSGTELASLQAYSEGPVKMITHACAFQPYFIPYSLGTNQSVFLNCHY